MELLQYWKTIRKSLWLTVLIVVLALGATAVYSWNQPTLYESSSTLLLNPSVPNSLIPEYKTQAAAGLADSYTALMRTRSFSDAVHEELTFGMSPADVSRAITTKLTPNTLFFKVSARMDSPEKARQLVSTAVKVLLSTVASQDKAGAGQGTDGAKSEMQQRLTDKLEYLGEQIKSYEAKIEDLQSRPASTDRDGQLLQARSQLFDLEQSETDTMLAIAQLSDNSARADVAFVIDQPMLGAAVPSRFLTNMGLAFAVSLLVGIGLAFLRDYLDYSVHSPEQMQELLGLAPLAVIGTIRRPGWRKYGKYGEGKGREPQPAGEAGKGAKASGRRLVTLEQPDSAEAESFRTLRTNLQFAGVGKPLRSIVVTSATPMEGKTFVAANLAVAMAQIGKRVVLVDGDLRRPTLHAVFGVSSSPGLTNLILAGSSAGIVQRVPNVRGLMVIASGPLPANPAELLDSERVTRVMSYLAEHADIVIYDSPPAGMVTDPAILGARVDAVILVARAGSTRRNLILGAKQALQNVGVSLILPVLNAVAPREMSTYQGYYRYYHARPDVPDEVPNSEPETQLDSTALYVDHYSESLFSKGKMAASEHEEAVTGRVREG